MDLVTRLNQRSFRRKLGVLLDIIEKLVWLQKVDFYSLDVTEWRPPSIPRMRLPVEFSFGNERDVLKMADNPHLDAALWLEDYLCKLHAGDRLLTGKLGGEIVFYIWIVERRKELMDRILLLKDDEFAIERVFTRKECRGQGLFLHAMNFLFPRMVPTGKTICLTEIASHNLPMVTTILKCGFRLMDSRYIWLSYCLGHKVFPKGPIAERCVRRSEFCAINQ